MILSGTLMLPADGMPAPRAVRLARGYVRLDGARIAEAGVGPSPGTPELGSDRTLITPGFIDTHLHLPQFDSIGIAGLPLLAWLERVIYPAETRWADADFAGQMTARVAGLLASHGTTGIGAYATVHHGAARAAIDALHESGLRAVVGQVLMDQNAPAELVRPTAQLLAEAARLSGRGRIEVAVTPRFAVACSGALLSGAGDLARRLGLPIQTHIAETADETRLACSLHDSPSYVDVYRRAGLLGPRTILAHGIWLTDDERRAIQTSASVIAHCPTANAFLGAGDMDRAGCAGAGIRLALGSDVAGGPDISMVRVARGMLETARRRGSDPPGALEAWWQITAGNADALGWPDAGRLVAGASADILAIEPPPGWQQAADPLSTLLHAWDDRWLTHTIVAGRAVYQRPS